MKFIPDCGSAENSVEGITTVGLMLNSVSDKGSK
jgi:hypothetical protein